MEVGNGDGVQLAIQTAALAAQVKIAIIGAVAAITTTILGLIGSVVIAVFNRWDIKVIKHQSDGMYTALQERLRVANAEAKTARSEGRVEAITIAVPAALKTGIEIGVKKAEDTAAAVAASNGDKSNP